ncbi:3-phytase A-like protein [Hapsidospora chrysogenum ATCC 11550]|uniref:Phytase A n=1 Tax=Hapsidospora chrysogenum (strain ATCC 11550 / CBS 779.69 / DSM 880 / IAM 14645 / JCM 23072 / IMI 49137) TaxID=857340 RepID=A0A086T5A7_HAPC1|nr:3-phytase A-like protein [Hapsidospora chrysogenum ATCC 11550]
MMAYLRKMISGGSYGYSAIPEPDSPLPEHRRAPWGGRLRRPVILALTATCVVVLLHISISSWVPGRGNNCEEDGSCVGTSPRLWGQYSPFFSVPSEVDPDIPAGCEVTFASVLSRHGARDPTIRKTVLYADVIERIQRHVTDYGSGFEFLQDYKYTLGNDQLTSFGEQQMVASGEAFGLRYRALVEKHDPFIRAAGQGRVIVSAEKFTQGLYAGLEGRDGDEQIGDILILPETDGFNNSLNHGACLVFENGPSSELGHERQDAWRETWLPPVRDRLNAKLPGANLSLQDTIFIMDLCPFNTVADPEADKSDFCRLFSRDEWRNYDYFESLEKWYGYGPGNPLGPTQGVGYVNELIARLTGEPVDDQTTTNSTLNASPETFPLDRKLYADFSHDNTMTSIYGALGLYNGTGDLPVEQWLPAQEAGGYSAAWTVPFAGRMYVEKMRCGSGGGGGGGGGGSAEVEGPQEEEEEEEEEELVRVLVNDRVVPLQTCEADSLGRCRLSAFVQSLSFARDGGLWHECFT